jgi:glycosyltransferase involved in cell wall biosynthesis
MRLITVGLPVYNAMPFLPETVESLLAQSYSDFELLIINDGSTDDSLEYLKALRDPRVRLVCQDNRGLTSTLNTMLHEAETPWLVRHDADDIAYPDRLAKTVEYIQRYPEAGMFYSHAEYYQQGRSFGSFRTTAAPPEVIRGYVRAGYFPAICHPAVTLNVKKTLLLGGYRFDLHIEDADLWWRMALSHDLRLIPDKTVGCRINEGSTSSRNLETQAINALYVQYLLLSHLWGLSPLPYEKAKLHLVALNSKKKLRFREQIRLANMSLGSNSYLKGAVHMLLAFLTSPSHFVERVAYEFGRESHVVNGIDPRIFVSHCTLLWPDSV